jgi:DNA-binding response OmpR family regulator
MKHLVLLIEGKRADRPSYMTGLGKKGFEVESVQTGSEALKKMKSIEPKAVIVDAASMRTSGTRICNGLKTVSADIPVILIVAEDQKEVNPECADEVLQLPFTLQKLLNRLKPYMSLNQNKRLVVGCIELDLKQRWVFCNGKRTRLTPRLFILMETLMRQPGEVLTREELFKKLWETDYLGDTRSLDVHISWLRQALEEDPRHPNYIKTERGVGYRLEVEKPKRPARTEKKNTTPTN